VNNKPKIRFLTLSEVLLIYEDQIRRYGGTYQVRDLSLLSSAIYVPQSTFDGEYLHKSIPAMAAAYLFHICENHALVDGNKRVSLASALVFLDINNYKFSCDEDALYDTVLSVAKSELKKDELIYFFEKHARKQNVS
jgi:death on curing protein